MDSMKVRLTLIGLDGNAFSLLGAFRRAAIKQGFAQEEIDAVLQEARSGDYNHLLSTLIAHTVDKDDNE